MPKMDWSKLLVEERFIPKNAFNKPKKKPFRQLGRTGFQSDMDRITFCSAFRRLQGKTQVHPLPKNDHIHNRLTHSLEAASVARTLGTAVGEGLEERKNLPNSWFADDLGSIVQAAALAHDIGNPPFGHACEGAIGEWFQGWLQEKGTQIRDFDLMDEDEIHDLKFFDGNAQGFRTLTRLERRWGKTGGLRLSYPTLAAFLKYPWTAASAPKDKKNKASAFFSEQKYLGKIAKKVGLLEVAPGRWCRHPLAYLTEAADDICYSAIDVEDALELGILNSGDYEKLRKILVSEDESVLNVNTPAEIRKLLASHRGLLFDRAIEEVVASFFANYDKIMTGKFQGTLLSKSKGDAAEYIKEALDIGKKRVYTERRKAMIEIGVVRSVETTLGTFCNAMLDRATTAKGKKIKETTEKVEIYLASEGGDLPRRFYPRLRRVADALSGMTDRYAVSISQQIGGDFE